MNFPEKITPDRIKDAIVEVRYTASSPFEVNIGLFFKSLDDSYLYIHQAGMVNISNRQTQISPAQYLFWNEKVKVEIKPDAIIFNCLSDYPGWNIYKEIIRKTLQQLTTAGVIEIYNRVGIRYISHYPGKRIKELTRFDFTFGSPQINSETCTFQTQFVSDNLRVILTLNDNINTLIGNTEQGTSFIDVDVIKDPLHIIHHDYDRLFGEIEEIHNKEKQVFFNLLKEEFLATLNPAY
jgi:uncharacterized protein (TIGR04255 family)